MASISHPHKKHAFQERGEKRDINHHLENFHHVFSSWLLASIIGIYSFIGTSFILETYAAAPSILPPQVTNLKGVVLTGSVLLAWNPVASSTSIPRVTDYVIRYKLSSKTSYKIFRDGVGTGAYTRVGPLKPGNTYDFRVAARNKKGLGAYSTKLRITIPPSTRITNSASPTIPGITGSSGDVSTRGEAPTPVPNQTPVNGVCGTSSGKILTSMPSDLCTTGTAGVVTSATFSYTWSCKGSNGGVTPTCTAYIETNYTYYWSTGDYGNCSLACGEGTRTRTVTCVRNDGAPVADSNCNTTKPPSSQSCNVEACTTPVNGVCGTLNGQTLTEALPLTPSTNFCTTGLSSAITSGDSSYTWTCSGTYGGITADCSASK